MSYNPSVGYRGPDPATRSVTDELTVRFGAPDRPYEFVTGWKDPGNVSGHNPDSNGITHGVDLFLTSAQNRWAADHLAARGRAGDKRVGYVIYAGQIASPSTGYEFAGSGWEHWDHPHLSVWDGYWGGPCTLPAHIYNDTSSWGIATLTGQGSGIIPITSEEEDIMAALDTIMARLEQIVDWLNAKFGANASRQDQIVEWAAANFKALAAGNAEALAELDRKYAELMASPAKQQLVKGDTDATVYAWDGGSGYRALGYPEFLALTKTGATLQVLPQDTLDAAVKK